MAPVISPSVPAVVTVLSLFCANILCFSSRLICTPSTLYCCSSFAASALRPVATNSRARAQISSRSFCSVAASLKSDLMPRLAARSFARWRRRFSFARSLLDLKRSLSPMLETPFDGWM